MERLGKREWLGLGALFLLLVVLFSYLPLRSHGRYLSPDETAMATSAKLWAEQGSAAVAEPLAWKFPGLHPRSYVSHYDTIVPVGFLGWPLINSILFRVVGQNLLPIAAMLIILSAVYPLYRLLRPLGQRAALLGTLIAFSSPGIILYANRSLFPNAGLIALAIWTCFWIKDMVIPAKAGIYWKTFVAGILVCLTLAIRPVECIWIVPWFAYFARNWKPSRNQLVAVVLGFVLALAPVIWQAQTLYGNFWQAGYLVQGNPDPNPSASLSLAQGEKEGLPILPFGIHPLYIGWNIFKFLLGPLFPWMVPLVLCSVIVILNKKRNKLFELGAWTLAVLVLYYGNGHYADNITGAITIGNSFVRYLMPLGVLSGVAFAYVYATSETRKNGRQIALIMAAILVIAGIFQAFFADNEGLWTVSHDSKRYDAINREAAKYFSSTDVILSDRSDKIFFPDFRAWSPLPSMETVSRLAMTSGIKIGLFARPMSQLQKDEWSRAGLNPVELYSNEREILYRLDPVQ